MDSEVNLGEKRAVGEDVEAGHLLKKVKKTGDGLDAGVLKNNMKEVAEMVLVLSAMGKMRGGKVPSQAEKDIMSAARDKLAVICQCFPPKDLFPRDAFGAIIEDLGLDKIKEQTKQFRPPNITITEKFLLSKRKLEKSEDFSVPPAARGSSQLPANSCVSIETRASPHGVRVFPSDKSNLMPVASGSFQTASPFGHATSSSSLPYQLPTSEVRPVVSSRLHPGRDPASGSMLMSDRLHFKVDRRSNGPSHVSHLQATNSGDHPSVKTTTWSMQPQSIPSAKFSTEAKVPMQNVVKLEGVANVNQGVIPQASTSKPIRNNTTSGNAHAEIGKFVLKVLQPESSDLPIWVPPSRDYMNRTLFCQICTSVINDVDSVLVCDACEKGFHLKCLQINNARGIPKGDWHCRKCLQLSHGKPLPPKFGRVMRNIGAIKLPTTAPSIPLSSNTKASFPDEKISQEKTLPNGNTEKQIVPSVSTIGDIGVPSSASTVEIGSRVRENDIVAGKGGEESSSEPNSNNSSPASGMNIVSPCMPSVKGVHELKLELKPRPVSNSEAAECLSESSQSQANTVDIDKAELVHDVSPKQPRLNDSCIAESLCDVATQVSSNELGSEQANSAATSTTTGDGNAGLERLVSDAVSRVDWVGDTLKVDDSKIFYHSCSIGGVVYKLQDNVLVQFPDNRVLPSKLQSMWEDSLTKSKWVTVNRYYFPGDLPEAVGRPCLESNEVYESTYGCTAIAGMVRGLCDVLPPNKFVVEKERQTRIGMMGSNDISQPLYFCKWIYDESKGLFRDVSC